MLFGLFIYLFFGPSAPDGGWKRNGCVYFFKAIFYLNITFTSVESSVNINLFILPKNRSQQLALKDSKERKHITFPPH